MICVRADQVVDDHYYLDKNYINTSTHANGCGGGFLFPLNFVSYIHKYFWRSSSGGSVQTAADDASSPPPSVSDSQETKSQDKRSRQFREGNLSPYKRQLEQEIKKLQQQLQEEIDLRVALASVVEQSDSSVTNSPRLLSNNLQEFLESIAVMEIAVSKLEQEAVTLQYQLSQERNERRLAEYRLRHFSCSTSPLFDFSRDDLANPMTRIDRKDEQGTVHADKPQPEDIIEVPKTDQFFEKLPNDPNQLSEEMVLRMSRIFIFLSDSSKLSSDCASISPQCSLMNLSSAHFSDTSVINASVNPSVDMQTDSEYPVRCGNFDPYKVPGKVDWIGSTGIYSMAIEVSWFSVGQRELEYASGALRRYRLLIEKLADVNPSMLSYNAKLAFWINVYNALVMHAFLAYGAPRSDLKSFSLMRKATYAIGGYNFSAIDIESNILKIKSSAHRPQIALLLNLQKFKLTEEQNKFSIDQPEPLLAFALSCGMHSSPAVRIFRPDNVNELLSNSLKDYVQASVAIGNKGRLLVPRLLYCYAKGVVDDLQIAEWICKFLSPEQATVIREYSSKYRWKLIGGRSFTVLPFDSRFRFLFLL